MANELNEIESTIVAAMQADIWLGDTANVAKIEEKLSPVYQSIFESDFPHIGVFCTGSGPESDQEQGWYEQTYNILIEIGCAGGYSSDVDTQAKKILAEVRRCFREQNRLDTRLSDSGITAIQNAESDVSANFEIEDSKVYLAYTYVTITRILQ